MIENLHTNSIQIEVATGKRAWLIIIIKTIKWFISTCTDILVGPDIETLLLYIPPFPPNTTSRVVHMNWQEHFLKYTNIILLRCLLPKLHSILTLSVAAAFNPSITKKELLQILPCCLQIAASHTISGQICRSLCLSRPNAYLFLILI